VVVTLGCPWVENQNYGKLMRVFRTLTSNDYFQILRRLFYTSNICVFRITEVIALIISKLITYHSVKICIVVYYFASPVDPP
jgi:hypothetical protein